MKRPPTIRFAGTKYLKKEEVWRKKEEGKLVVVTEQFNRLTVSPVEVGIETHHQLQTTTSMIWWGI
ncbi:MAG: hypothetical protein AB3A66_18330 [Nodularia sp. CChRGM 3473]